MAQPTTNGCLKGCIISVITIILVLILVVVIGSVVLLNMTPEKLGIADAELTDGMTFRSIGLADTKIKDIIKSLKNLMDEPDEDDIVSHTYNEDVEKSKMDDTMDNGSLTKKPDGSYDFMPILSENIVYDAQYLKTYSDTTIAYMFDSIIHSNDNPDYEGLEFLREVNASIVEVSITKEGSAHKMRLVARADLNNYSDEIKNELPAFLASRIPSKVYLVSYSTIGVNEEGKLVAQSADFRVNDADDAIADAIFRVLASDIPEASDKHDLNNNILSAFAEVIYHLGKIGSAEADIDTGVVFEDTVVYDNSGLGDHSFTVITHIASDTAEEGATDAGLEEAA